MTEKAGYELQFFYIKNSSPVRVRQFKSTSNKNIKVTENQKVKNQKQKVNTSIR